MNTPTRMGMVAAGIALMAWTAEVGWQLIVGAALIGLAIARYGKEP